MSFVKILFGNKKEEICCGVEIIEIENNEDPCCKLNSTNKSDNDSDQKSKKEPCCP